MQYMQKIVLLSLLIAGLFAAKKSDYAKILSSDIQTTIIEFKLKIRVGRVHSSFFILLIFHNDQISILRHFK